jgi:hypothetical protein
MYRNRFLGVVSIVVLFLGAMAHCDAEDTSEKNEPKQQRKPKPSPLITISKETTRISGPIADDGYVMYLEALRLKCKDGVTPERNVVVSLWQAIGPYGELRDADFQKDYFKEMGIDPLPKKGDYYVNIHDVAREHLGAAAADPEVQKLTNELWEQYDEATNGPWTKKEYPLLAKWIESNKKPMEVAVKGIMTRDQYYAPLLAGDDEFGNMLIGVLLPTAMQTREFARLLSARAMYRLGGDDVEGAMNDLLACHRLARHYSKAPTLIEALVCYAIEGIASGGDFNLAHHAKLATKQTKWYHDQLAKMPPPPSVVRCLDICERYGYLDCAVMMARQGPGAFNVIDALAGGGGGGAKVDNPVTRLLARAAIDWDEPMKMGNQFYDRIVAAASLPTFKERAAAAEKIDEEFEKLAASAKDFSGIAASILGVKSARKEIGKKIGTILCALLLPATSAASNAEERIHVGIDLSKLSYAISAYRTEHGKYPDKLDELAPKYIKEVPQDRYSGEPLVYKRESGGYMLYSIGGNLKDDRGVGPFTDGRLPQDDLAVRSPEIMDDKDE